jgi:hypothetical protein
MVLLCPRNNAAPLQMTCASGGGMSATRFTFSTARAVNSRGKGPSRASRTVGKVAADQPREPTSVLGSSNPVTSAPREPRPG